MRVLHGVSMRDGLEAADAASGRGAGLRAFRSPLVAPLPHQADRDKVAWRADRRGGSCAQGWRDRGSGNGTASAGSGGAGAGEGPGR